MHDNLNLSKSTELTLESIDKFILQGQQIWNQYNSLVFSSKYYQIENIIICGMGGSSLPAHILKSTFRTKLPLQIIEGYALPSWANEKTLVILSSYSGETEETLSCAVHAEENQCVITGITTGGKLEKFFTGGGYTFCKIDPVHNPSQAPRYSLGYGIFGILRILSKLELLERYDEQSLEKEVSKAFTNVTVSLPIIKQKSIDILANFKNKLIVVMVAEHLGGVGRTAVNLLNETSKAIAFYKHIPEANHNLIQGFTELKEHTAILFLRSQKYTARILRRMDITKKILDDNGYTTYVYQMDFPFLVEPPSLLEETLNNILFCANMSVNLAIEKQVNPLEIPIIDSIKRELLGSY